METWELADEEIEKVYGKVMVCKLFGETDKGAKRRAHRAIATAAARKVAEWGEQTCLDHQHDTITIRFKCWRCCSTLKTSVAP